MQNIFVNYAEIRDAILDYVKNRTVRVSKNGIFYNVEYVVLKNKLDIRFLLTHEIHSGLEEKTYEGKTSSFMFVLDIDNEDMEARKKAFLKVVSLYDKIGLKYFYDQRYHIFANTLLKEDYYYVILQYFQMLIGDWGKIDMHVLSNNKVFRTPYTLYAKNDRFLLFPYHKDKILSKEEFFSLLDAKEENHKILKELADKLADMMSVTQRLKRKYQKTSKALVQVKSDYKYIDLLANNRPHVGIRFFVLTKYIIPYAINVAHMNEEDALSFVEKYCKCFARDEREYNEYMHIAEKYIQRKYFGKLVPPTDEEIVNSESLDPTIVYLRSLLLENEYIYR